MYARLWETFVFINEIHSRMGYDTSFGLMSYGPEWKLRRRAFWQHFNPTAVGNYQPVQRSTARTFLRTLLEHSQDVEEHIAE